MKNTDNPLFNERYEELAAAIIGQAIYDYVHNGHYLNNNPAPTETIGVKKQKYENKVKLFNEAKAFFYSEHFLTLSGGNTGMKEYLLGKMNKLIHLGKEEVLLGKPHKITTVVLNNGITILYNRVRDALVSSN